MDYMFTGGERVLPYKEQLRKIPRMKKVVDGTDQGDISEAVGWKGGGGFRYYRLAPSLLEKDKRGQ